MCNIFSTAALKLLSWSSAGVHLTWLFSLQKFAPHRPGAAPAWVTWLGLLAWQWLRSLYWKTRVTFWTSSRDFLHATVPRGVAEVAMPQSAVTFIAGHPYTRTDAFRALLWQLLCLKKSQWWDGKNKYFPQSVDILSVMRCYLKDIFALFFSTSKKLLCDILHDLLVQMLSLYSLYCHCAPYNPWKKYGLGCDEQWEENMIHLGQRIECQVGSRQQVLPAWLLLHSCILHIYHAHCTIT